MVFILCRQGWEITSWNFQASPCRGSGENKWEERRLRKVIVASEVTTYPATANLPLYGVSTWLEPTRVGANLGLKSASSVLHFGAQKAWRKKQVPRSREPTIPNALNRFLQSRKGKVLSGKIARSCVQSVKKRMVPISFDIFHSFHADSLTEILGRI